MKDHLNSPDNAFKHKRQGKYIEITAEAEHYLPGLVLVGLWEGKTEHAALVVTLEDWKNEETMQDLISKALEAAGVRGRIVKP